MQNILYSINQNNRYFKEIQVVLSSCFCDDKLKINERYY